VASWLQHPPDLTDRDLAVIVRLVYEKSGIALHAGKRALVMARLQKRLKQGGFDSFKAYVEHLRSDKTGDEIAAMLDAIATNHTAFFREPQHFEFLAEVVLPALQARRGRLPILGWTAACSTGEEAYTLAITAFQALGDDAGGRMRLLASDLSSKALRHAAAGVYKAERVTGLPRHVVLKYFAKQPAPHTGMLQVVAPVRRIVEFRRLNLIHLPAAGQAFDFIFCRNAMIYFDRDAQQRVIQGLEARLAPGGYLFTSHSESLNTLRHGLTWIAPSVYRRAGP
jgi:chemotaxis protein methyltransferase CheR